MESLKQLKQSIRQVIRQYMRKFACLVCGLSVPMRSILNHFERAHPTFDLNSQCLLCLNNHEGKTHFYNCVQSSSVKHWITKICGIKFGTIQTEPAKRFHEDVMSFESEPFETAGRLDEAASYLYTSKGTFMSNGRTRHLSCMSPTQDDKEILFQQRSSDQILEWATRVTLSYQSARWYHLIISQMHINEFRRLVKDRTDIFIPNFWCWCNSRNVLDESQSRSLNENQICHLHLLATIDWKKWKQEVWNQLASSGAKYKLMRRIKDVEHLTRVLFYCSQTRCSVGEEKKHYNIFRPIVGRQEPIVLLNNPLVLLDDIHNYLHKRVDTSNFDIYKTRLSPHYTIFYTPLSQIMAKLEHFNQPLDKGTLCLVDDITVNDKTIATCGSKFVNVVGNRRGIITTADVMNLIFPEENYVWSYKKHTFAETLFAYHENLLNGQSTFVEGPNGYSVEQCKPRKRKEIDGVSIDIETTGLNVKKDEIIQLGMYKRGVVCFNCYMVPTVDIHPRAFAVNKFQVQQGKLYKDNELVPTTDRNTCRQLVISILKQLVDAKGRAKLLAKNGNSLDFPMLRKFLGEEALRNVDMIDTRKLLKRKLETYATDKDMVHDAIHDAMLHDKSLRH